MVNELNAVLRQLGGASVLGRRVRTDVDLQSAIRAGFPQPVVEKVMHAMGLNLTELARSLDLSPRSLHRRRSQERLARHESDKLYRLARIAALAKHSLGDEDAALRWMRRANRALGGQAPIECVDTEPGARAVENVLV